MVEEITSECTRVDRITLKNFNELNQVNIKEGMDYIDVHDELTKIKDIRCGIVEKDFNKAMRKLLTCIGEYIINIEETYYLCVKTV